MWSHNAELDTIDVSGRDFANSKKFRDVRRSGRVALVVDDTSAFHATQASLALPQRQRQPDAGVVARQARAADPVVDRACDCASGRLDMHESG
jgi:hypothetical protein